MHYIDKLLEEEKEEGTISMILEAWEKKMRAENKILTDLDQRLAALERRLTVKEIPS